MSARIHPGLLLAAVVISFACHTPTVKRAHPILLERPELAFLEDGVTTRADALLAFGEPASAFEDARVLTWQLGQRDDGSVYVRLPHHRPLEAASWAMSLVLVFSADGLLERHSVVVAE